ncbi:chloramphenicol phosphotransferase CPT family protein [Leisingera daeponensis]|uniref:Chloramphenicol phosphotransferase CPT family protein n=1 Tax=Leisingera daeponensis TaxID=405746 RepID=A0ABS7NMR5_9RHOB|nr:chloramphenicol phosphotransferase CPT family protein [Leisingera daeponensis]MBY6142226.1 chloramphenicol phosphotransferase CPT family protein [Leisingera daeponensis]
MVVCLCGYRRQLCTSFRTCVLFAAFARAGLFLGVRRFQKERLGQSKTLLAARVLQAKIEKPFRYFSIDLLRDTGDLPSARFKTGDFNWRSYRSAFFRGCHASLAAFADAGNNLILEHILDEEQRRVDLRSLLAAQDVCFVGMHCTFPRDDVAAIGLHTVFKHHAAMMPV